MAFEMAWRVLGNANDAEDAVQDAFMDALRIFREQAVDNWGGLLRRLASCRALDLLRKRQSAEGVRSVQRVDAGVAAPPSAEPLAMAVAVESATLLRQALARLPAREAEVFSLR